MMKCFLEIRGSLPAVSKKPAEVPQTTGHFNFCVFAVHDTCASGNTVIDVHEVLSNESALAG